MVEGAALEKQYRGNPIASSNLASSAIQSAALTQSKSEHKTTRLVNKQVKGPRRFRTKISCYSF